LNKNFDPLIPVDDDGLEILKGHTWAKKKYKLVGGYCDIFTRAMRKKWETLVYIDLFSGPGYTLIQETNEILRSSPLISLSIPNNFDVYVFCDQNQIFLDALRIRVKRDFPDKNVNFLNGDVNNLTEKIIELIPSFSKTNKVLSFCFADPFDLNLKFSTIEKLTKDRLIDILILQAYYMDGNRNFINYLNENNNKISRYLNDESWRDDFSNRSLQQNEFVPYLAEKFEKNMKIIKYLEPKRNKIQIPIKNVPLYYLEFYSKNSLGNDFYKKVQYYADDQLSLDI